MRPFVMMIAIAVFSLVLLAPTGAKAQQKPCTYRFMPPAVEFDFEGGTEQIEVMASAPECRPAVSSRYPWVKPTISQIEGKTVITVVAEASDGRHPRSADIAVDAQRITVSQRSNPMTK